MPLSHACLCARLCLLVLLGAGSAIAGCPGDDGGLPLPAGFCATLFADEIGHARHLVVLPGGTFYVNTWSGRYYGSAPPPAGGFLLALKDTHGSGKADVLWRFGETVQTGGSGGTGIGLYDGWLYADINDRIVRYALPDGKFVPEKAPQIARPCRPWGVRSCQPTKCLPWQPMCGP